MKMLVTNMNEDFIAQVRWLKEKKIIKRDKEIAMKTGYKASAVSNFLAGRRPVSKKFQEKFTEVFNLKNSLPSNADTSAHDVEDYIYTIPLSGNKTAQLKYPRTRMTMDDVEIMKTVIRGIELSVSVHSKKKHSLN